jgi:aerobic carbon-monoxide dehydrogenase medium subunit
MKPAPFEYVRVDTVDAAVAALGRYDGNARCLAGGQSLVALLNMRLLRPSAVIDLNGVPGLDGIELVSEGVRIGALTRYAALERSRVVSERLPLLARAVPFVGDRQVRNRGTFGGALCHADPSGEMALVAVTLGATLDVVGPGGARRLTAEEFFLGPYTTALEPADVLAGVTLPGHAASSAVVVEHTRKHGDFAVVAVAAVGERAADGTWRGIRIGLGGVSDRPVRASRAASLLEGTRLDVGAIRAAAEAALEVSEPTSDVRASAEYRRHLVPIFVERALDALARVPGPSR